MASIIAAAPVPAHESAYSVPVSTPAGRRGCQDRGELWPSWLSRLARIQLATSLERPPPGCRPGRVSTGSAMPAGVPSTSAGPCNLRRRVRSYWGDLGDRPHLTPYGRPRSPASRRWPATPSTRPPGWSATCSNTRRPCWNRTARRAGGARLHPAGSPVPRAPPRPSCTTVEPVRGARHFGPYLGGLKVRLAVSAPAAGVSAHLRRRRDHRFAAGHGPGPRSRFRADRDAIIAAIIAVLGRDPATVAALRDGLARRRDEAAASLAFELAGRLQAECEAVDWVVSEQRADPARAAGPRRVRLVRRRAGRSEFRGYAAVPVVQLDTALVWRGRRPATGLAATPPDWAEFARRNADLAARLGRPSLSGMRTGSPPPRTLVARPGRRGRRRRSGPGGLADRDAVRHRRRRADDRDRPPAGRSAGPGVVVAHGRAGSARLMRGFADTLAARGYVVVLPDFHRPRRQRRPMTFGDTGAPDVLQDDLDAAVRHLRSPARRSTPPASASLDTRWARRPSPGTRSGIQTSRPPWPSRSGRPTTCPATRRGRATCCCSSARPRCDGFRDAAVDGLHLADPAARLGTTIGDPAPGTARRAVSVAGGRAHLGPVRHRTHEEAADWLDAALGAPGGGRDAPAGPARTGRPCCCSRS